MPGASIRVGGAHVTFSADASRYTSGTGQAINANRRFQASFAGIGQTLDRFRTSVASSLIATAAYAAGIGAVTAAVRASFGGFVEYDQGLVRVAKTTGLAEEAIDRLGQSLVRINTVGRDGRRAIDISREDILNIAQAAGQAGVTDEGEIETITRASAALQSSSDLIGTEAVRALTRYLQVTGQGIDQTDAFASAFTHLGNNIVGTESEIARFATRAAQNLSAFATQSNGFILGVSATLLEAGVEQEAAGSALQRAQKALLDASRDPEAFQFIARNSSLAAEGLEEIRLRMLEGTATAQDLDRAFLAFLETFRNVQAVGSEESAGRSRFLAEFVGGGEANVRNSRVIAALANNYERLERNIDISNEGLDTQNAHYEEAARAAESYGARLRTVGRELAEQGTAVGSVIVPAFVALAEQYQLIEVAAAAAAVAVAAGFGTRALHGVRETTRALQAQVVTAQERAQAATQTARIARIEQLQAQRAVSASFVAGGAAGVTSQDRRRLQAANRNLANRTREAAAATAALNQAQATAARRALTLGNVFRRLGAGLVAFTGGPVGLVLTALTLVGGAIFALRSNAEGADSALEDLLDRADDFAESASRAGQTATENILSELNAELAEARQRLEEALAAPETRRGGRAGQGAVEVVRQEDIDAATREVERLEEAIRNVENASRDAAETTTRTNRRIAESFREVGTSLQPVINEVRRQADTQADAIANAQRDAEQRIRNAGADPVDAVANRLLDQQQRERAEALASAQRGLADAARVRAESEARLAEAIRIRNRTEEFSEARGQADRQVETLEREVRANERLIDQYNARIAAQQELNRQPLDADAARRAAEATVAADEAERRANRTNPLRELTLDVTRLTEQLENVAAGGLRRFEDTLVGVFETGKFALNDLVNAIGTDLLQALIRTTITANLARAALAFFPGLGGGGPLGIPTFHSGGVAGSRRAPLSSPTGLRGGEVFAVLEAGEEILTRRDPRHRWNLRGSSWSEIRDWVNSLPRYHQGGVVGGAGALSNDNGAGGIRNIRFEIINQTGQATELVDNGMRIDLDSLVVSAIQRNLNRNGTLARSLGRR